MTTSDGPARTVFRSGLVTIVGRPNVGKSTLLNRLVGRKVAIMSEKPQTTRNRIAGVVHRDASQIVFLDTPGLHRPRDRLSQYMVGVALAALEEVEAVLFMVEAPLPPGPGDRYVAGHLSKTKTPVILVANKADLCSGDLTRQNLALYRALGDFAAFTALSAKADEGFELLLRTVETVLPEGPRYYPEGLVTDQPEGFILAELVREQILELTREEIPHSVAVVVEEMRLGGRRVAAEGEAGAVRTMADVEAEAGAARTMPFRDALPPHDVVSSSAPPGLLYVRAVVYVEHESQKGIIIGAGGTMLRAVGQGARREIEALFGVKIYLDLWVKVEKNWRDKAVALRSLGYTTS